MRIVRVEVQCGWHKAVKDEEVEAVEEREVTLGRGRPRLVAVCEDCREAWLMPLLAAFEAEPLADSVTEPRQPRSKVLPEQVRRRGGRRAQDLPLVCREPGCVDKRTGDGPHKSPNRSALGAHVAGAHGKRLSDYDWD